MDPPNSWPPSSLPPPIDDETWNDSYQRMAKGLQAVPTGDPVKLFQAFQKMRRGEVDFDHLPAPTGIGRVISVPLQKLDKCSVCSKTNNLRLCSSCASVIYCSRDCQKFAWKDHKRFCSQTQQINLKTFYPFIAYMFESLRRLSPRSCGPYPPISNPFLDTTFDKLGRRPSSSKGGPEMPPLPAHPALCRRILKAPHPGSRKATSNESSFHNTVVLGEKYDLQISTFPEVNKLTHWWKGRPIVAAMQMYLHVSRETHILEITLAVALLLLSEIYSTHMTKTPPSPRSSSVDHDNPENLPKWEPRCCYRIEYGHSPVSDFGICRGRIKGKANRVQTWTYYEPKTNTRTDVLDPNRHYWLYFRTIKGEELYLDCCSFPFGMEACVDAAPCLRNLASMFRHYGSARTPAHLYSPSRPEECPNTHSLIEDQRFSVMQNKSLFNALGWELFGGKDPEQHQIIQDFISQVQGRPCTQDQEDKVAEFRTFGALMIGQVLSGKLWKEWGKATVYPRDDCFDPKSPNREEWVRSSPEDPTCHGKLNGLFALFGDVLGIGE